MILKKQIKLKKIILVALFLLTLNSVSLANEVDGTLKVGQIDLKQNVYARTFGKDSHLVTTNTLEVLPSGRIVAIGRILDYPNYIGFVLIYNNKGEILKFDKVYGYGYEGKVKEIGDDIYIVMKDSNNNPMIRKYIGEEASSVRYHKAEYINEKFSFSSVFIEKSKNNINILIGSKYYLIELVYDNNLNKIREKKYKITGTLVNVVKNLNDDIRFIVRNGSRTYYNKIYTYVSYIVNSTNVWPYTDDSYIRDIINLDESRTLIYGNKYYRVINNKEVTLEEGLIEDSPYKEFIENKNKDINKNETIENLKINNTDKNIHINNNYVYLESKNSSNKKIDIVKILNDIKLTIDTKSVYVGNDGLRLTGTLKDKSKDKYEIAFMLNGIEKKTIIDTKNSDKFELFFSIDELVTWSYKGAELTAIPLDVNKYVYFENIPNGSRINYEDVYYIKLDKDLVIEEYPEDNNAVSATYIKDRYEKYNEAFLTSEEYFKYREYLNNNEGLYRFWLKDNKYVSTNMEVNRSYNKYLYNYIRKIRRIDINEKFYKSDVKNTQISEDTNETIDTYFMYKEIDKIKEEIDIDIEVSHEIPNKPNIDGKINDEWSNEDIIVNITCDKDNEIYYKINSSEYSLYDREINLCNDGIYEISAYTKNKFGNKSQEVTKIFKIDKTSPVVDKVYYEDIDGNPIEDKWIKSEEAILKIIVNEEMSKIKCETILRGEDSYEIKQIDLNKYEYTCKIKIGETKDIIIRDNAQNILKETVKCELKLDNKNPEISYETVEDNKEYVLVKLNALDNESNIKHIKYKINNEDEKTYDMEIKLLKCDYDRNTKLEFYAADNACNISELKTVILDLNDSPSIELIESKKEYAEDEDIEIKAVIEDKDLTDLLDVRLTIEIKGSIITLGEIKNLKASNEEIVFNIPYEKIDSLPFYEDIILHLEADDKISIASKNIIIRKLKEMPSFKIEASNTLNFKDYTEVNIDSKYKGDIKLYYYEKENDNSRRVNLYSSKLNKGLNKIIIRNIDIDIDIDKVKIYAEVSNGYNKKLEYKSLEINKPLKDEDSDVFIFNINEKRDIEFYKYIKQSIDKNKGTNKKVIIMITDIEEYKKVISIIDKTLEENFIIVNKELSLEEINEILKEKTDSKVVIENGKAFKISDINFYDYEEDYYDIDNKRGKNTMIEIIHDKYIFENNKEEQIGKVKEKYEELNIYDNEEIKEDIENKDYKEIKLNKVGRYTIKVTEDDHLISRGEDKSLTSMPSIKEIYVHRKPYCSLDYEVNDDNTIKVIKKSYDLDFLSVNNGIKEEALYVEILDAYGEQIECNKVAEASSIYINPKYTTNIIYEVKDYGISIDDTVHNFTNTCSLTFDKNNTDVICDFDYITEKTIEKTNKKEIKYVTYVYRGNERAEKVSFKEDVEYNDFFKIAGERKLIYDIPLEEFRKKLETEYIVKNRLKAINKCNNFAYSKEHSLDVIDLKVINTTENNYDNEKGFNKKRKAKVSIEINQIANEDLIVRCDGKKMQTKDGKKYYIYLDISELNEDDIKYKIEVSSNRTEEILDTREYSFKIYDDIKIYNFNVYDIADPVWKKKFERINYYADRLPFGRESINAIKKGYTFNFSMYSVGLDEDDDKIIITPRFYHVDTKKGLREEAKFYKRVNDTYVLYNEVNNESIVLDKNNREEIENFHYWEGAYHIPYDAVLIKDNKIDKTGYIVINFEIDGYKGNEHKFSYMKKQWNIEKDDSTLYEDGDTIIYSNSRSLLFDIESAGIY